MKKLDKLLREEKQEALKKKDIFSSLSKLLSELSLNISDIIPERQTRHEAANTGNNFVEFHSYLLNGYIEVSLERVTEEISKIGAKLM